VLPLHNGFPEWVVLCPRPVKRSWQHARRFNASRKLQKIHLRDVGTGRRNRLSRADRFNLHLN